MINLFMIKIQLPLTMFDTSLLNHFLAKVAHQPVCGAQGQRLKDTIMASGWNLTRADWTGNLTDILVNLSASCNDSQYGVQHDTENTASFFDIYYSQARFVCESALATVAMLANVLAVILTLCRHHGDISVYQVLFLNLGAANVVSCISAWLSNNLLYLFDHAVNVMVLQEHNLCKFFVYLSAGVFVMSATALVSTSTVLGFVTVQYIAICKPLEQAALVRKSKVGVFVITTWIVTLTVGCVPLVVLVILANTKTCTTDFLHTSIKTVLICVDCHVTMVGLVDLVAILMCARIYYEIRQLHKRLSHFRFQQDIKREERKFITSVLLLAIMTLFLLPYTLLYVVTLNKKDTFNMHDNFLVYYMNLLPHAKFLSDPLIYGLRMREMRCYLLRAWYMVRASCLCSSHRCTCGRRKSISCTNNKLCSTSL